VSEQSDALNAMARKHMGAAADEAAASTGVSVLTDAERGRDEDKRLEVELPGRNERKLVDFARDMGACLKSTPLFRRENIIVTVDHENGMLKPMTAERFLSWVEDYTLLYDWVTVGKGKAARDEKIGRTMPLTTARGCLASDAFYYQVRKIARVNSVRLPVFRKDGRPELLPEGYDDESQVFTMTSRIPIDEKMDLVTAKGILDDYYSEFPWADLDSATGLSRSKAVAITMALALFGIGLQPIEDARMGCMVRANTQGGGKSLVAQMAIAAPFGLPKNTPRAGEEELRKVLDTAAMQGASYLFFDNLKNHLESALLEGFMTSPVWGGRVMGTQLSFEASKSTMLIITGNNLSVSPDLQRRLLQCDLHVENFDLQEKQHRRDLNPVVMVRPEVRGEFLSALWALVRNWYAIGRPPAGTREKPYRVATFKEWSDIFGGAVQAAGYGNPLVKPAEDQLADQKTPHQRKLVEILAQTLTAEKPSIEYTFQELVDCCHESELMSWLLEGKLKPTDGSGDRMSFEVSMKCASKMGRMFTDEMSGKIGRIFVIEDGRRVRFIKRGEGRAKRYWVELLGVPAAAAA
jgi:hypothetical protein